MHQTRNHLTRPEESPGQPPSGVGDNSRPATRISDRSIALLLAAFTIALLAATARDVGLTWDEPVYITASEDYMSWLGELMVCPKCALSDDSIREYWELNREHPPFDKLWSGLVWAGARFVLDDLTAHRLGNIILSGVLVAVLFLIVAQGYGRAAGLAAAGALLTMPRFFFHAHLAALDVPVAAMIFLTTFLFWRMLNRQKLIGVVWTGIAAGFALGTKINALVELPILFGGLAFFLQRRHSILIRIVPVGIIGVLLWLLLWPWLYHDTLNRLLGYVDFMTFNHSAMEQYYLGRWLSPPPSHFPFVMTLMVLPLTLTILAAVGSVRVLKAGRRQAMGWLFLLGALVPMLILATGKTQVFDNDRLLLPSFPFIAALSGVGFSQAILGIQRLTRRPGRGMWAPPLIFVLAVISFFPQTAVAYSLYPHLLSYYSETVGGLSGARSLGMETTYWAETYSAALPYLNEYAPSGATVWVEAHDVMLYYQSRGMVRPDLRIASPFGDEGIIKGVQGVKATIVEADLAVIQYREAGLTDGVTNWLRGRKPVYHLRYQDIPLMEVYTR